NRQASKRQDQNVAVANYCDDARTIITSNISKLHMNPLLPINRRQFMKETAAIGAVCVTQVELLGAESAAPDALKIRGKIRVGHIGCGNVSGSYLPNLTSQP